MVRSIANQGFLMAKQSTLTGIGAVLFAAGLVLLFAALFRDAAHGGPLLWTGLVVLAATFGCWFAAAKAETA
jgi:hypothetical protein